MLYGEYGNIYCDQVYREIQSWPWTRLDGLKKTHYHYDESNVDDSREEYENGNENESVDSPDVILENKAIVVCEDNEITIGLSCIDIDDDFNNFGANVINVDNIGISTNDEGVNQVVVIGG